MFKQRENLFKVEFMHPSKDIKATKGSELEGRKVALCVTGSVAVTKCPELARELMRHGVEVRVCMSQSATALITPELMHWATGNEVVVKLTGKLEHVELASWADLVLITPSTANTIGKVAMAVDDTPVTSLVSVALGLKKSIVIVPAMHGSMFEHQLIRKNLDKLRAVGVRVIDPNVMDGKAKLASVEEIVQTVIEILGPRDLGGKKVVVTAGPTVELIDPIKFISNNSSGKMGLAVARAAASRGGDVTLIYGPGTEMPPFNVELVRVQTTKEMRDAFLNKMKSGPDIIVSAAAAQDFVVEQPADKKLRHSDPVTLKLVPAPRVLGEVRELAPNAFVVGFKAEYGVSNEELMNAAKSKLNEGLDMVVANDVSRVGAGFGTDTNEVLIVTKFGSKNIRASKIEIAKAILDGAVAGLG